MPFTDSLVVSNGTEVAPESTKSTGVDTNSYIPLGSVTIRHHDATNQLAGSWAELNASKINPIGITWAADLTLLVQNEWCRVFAGVCSRDTTLTTLRIYLLPDDVGRATVPRSNAKLRGSLRTVLTYVDRTALGWHGQKLDTDEMIGYTSEYVEDDSLFYMFNTLPSPQPDPDLVEDYYASSAMQEVMNGSVMPGGLRTDLYPYQRRSAAAMIQKESQPIMRLDPRLEELSGPQGNRFFLDRNRCLIFVDGRWYHESRGGILGETMGYGKTLICLAVILATKGHLPEIPPDCMHDIDKNKATGCRSLALQAAATIARNNVQWQLYFSEQRKYGRYYDKCTRLLEANIRTYTTETIKGRGRHADIIRNTFNITATTLVVVPSNLLQQWRQQLDEHLDAHALRVLYVDDRSVSLPDSAAMHDYDTVILTQQRFEEEIYPLRGNHTDLDSIRSCLCSEPNRRRLCQEHPYRSPLLGFHFLRFIVDEGVGFMSSGSRNQAITALQAIRVERKWIVSGTPANSLIGAEVELATEQNIQESDDRLKESSSRDRLRNDGLDDFATVPSMPEPQYSQAAERRSISNGKGLSKVQRTLAERKKATDMTDEREAIGRLGTVVKSFLGLQPWSNPEGEDVANWNSYFLPDKNGNRKQLSLKNALRGLVIRHQYEDLESDLQLPSLENKYVYLQPSFLDKLSMNLFLVQLIINAVTSERKDQDYMFHPSNRKSLEVFVRNLRHSGFFWCGLVPSELEKTCEVAKKYLDKENVSIPTEDRRLMEDAIDVGQIALGSAAWRAFADTHEIGLFVQDFPEGLEKTWSLCQDGEAHISPLLVGAAELHQAQQQVEASLYHANPISALEAGPIPIRPGVPARNVRAQKNGRASGTAKTDPSLLSENSMPESFRSLEERPKIPTRADRDLRLRNVSQSTLQENRRLTATQAAGTNFRYAPLERWGYTDTHAGVEHDSTRKSILKRIIRKPDIPPTYDVLARAQLIGTPSAKLSYLIGRINALHRTEKILVFYENDDIAFYCAQALEILEVPHRIYAAGISNQLRNQYQTAFNVDETIRVMLVDLKQAALGLHLAAASRVFFVNPVWQPGIEAQAIKRAHRIGSKKDIKTETLVLKGTLEEDLLRRRESMDPEEHRKASRSLLDDAPMKNILENARLLPLTREEIDNELNQVARIETPAQIFARSIVLSYEGSEATLHAALTMNSHSTQPPPHPPETAETKVSRSGEYIESSPNKSRKRKLVFVDELERQKIFKSRRLSESSPGTLREIDDTSIKQLGKRKTYFADEKDLPLTTVHTFELVEDTIESAAG